MTTTVSEVASEFAEGCIASARYLIEENHSYGLERIQNELAEAAVWANLAVAAAIRERPYG